MGQDDIRVMKMLMGCLKKLLAESFIKPLNFSENKPYSAVKIKGES